jgi:hypothetical protein
VEVAWQGAYRYKPSTFLAHVGANVVHVSSLALLKCYISGANGLSPRTTGVIYVHELRESLGIMHPLETDAPFFTLSTEPLFAVQRARTIKLIRGRMVSKSNL